MFRLYTSQSPSDIVFVSEFSKIELFRLNSNLNFESDYECGFGISESPSENEFWPKILKCEFSRVFQYSSSSILESDLKFEFSLSNCAYILIFIDIY